MKINFVDPNVLFLLLGLLVSIIGFWILMYGMISWFKSGNRIRGRLEHYVSVKNQRKSRILNSRILPREVSGSLFNRTLIPWIKSAFTLLAKFAPESQTTKLDHELAIAGNPYKLRARDFYVLRFLFLVAGCLIAFFINRNNLALDFMLLLVGGLVIIFSFILPTAWLSSKVRATKDEIRRDLPDALDMLSVCASAGLGFDQSLQKISSYWKTALGTELKRVIHEMEMGIARSSALKNLSDRLDVDDLSRFITIIIQAEIMGMSYADVLHSQAAQMRILRQFRAKEMANRLPARMIVPLATLIFPALIAVIVGPIIPTLLDLF